MCVTRPPAPTDVVTQMVNAKQERATLLAEQVVSHVKPVRLDRDVIQAPRSVVVVPTLARQVAVTAWANDFNFDDYLKREFSTLANKNDVLFIFSTSGGNVKKQQSINLIKLAKYAKSKKINIISLLGKGGGFLKNLSNISVVINSNNTASIQEIHKIIFHSIAETFENI